MTYLSYQVLECKSDTSLVSCWRVLHAHGHNDQFPEAKWGKGSCVLDVIRVNKCLGKGICQVYFAPEFFFLHNPQGCHQFLVEGSYQV